MTERQMEEAKEAYKMMYEFDEQDNVDKALKSANIALALYTALSNTESAGDVYVFLGDFENARLQYSLALEELGRGRRNYYQRDSEEAYRYGSRHLDAHIKMIRDRIAYVSNRETPPYLRTLKRADRGKINLVAFDLDGTLTNTKTNIWAILNERFGIVEESRKLEQRYRSGELNYVDWASKALQLLCQHGANEKTLNEAIEPIGFVPGGVYKTLFELKEHKKKLAILSGSLDMVVKKLFGPEDPEFAGRFFDSIIINRIYFNDNGSIEGFGPTYYGDGKYKAEGLRELSRKFGFRLKECAYVGDDSNDIEVAKIAGLSIAFNQKSDELRKACDVVIEEPNLELIVPHILTRDDYGSKRH